MLSVYGETLNNGQGEAKMSLIIEESLICDGPDCCEVFGIGMGCTFAALLRKKAIENGWCTKAARGYNKTKDYCPECLAKENTE